MLRVVWSTPTPTPISKNTDISFASLIGALTEIVGGNFKASRKCNHGHNEIAMEHNLGLTCDPVQGILCKFLV